MGGRGVALQIVQLVYMMILDQREGRSNYMFIVLHQFKALSHFALEFCISRSILTVYRPPLYDLRSVAVL